MGGDKTQVFTAYGPEHMIDIEIDWDNEEHVRCITACLVKGTYVLERDRTSEAKLAPAWWKSFHFHEQCDYKLEFECKKCAFCRMARKVFHGDTSRQRWCIYGAVFQYAPPPDAKVANRQSAPSYIVAFRGTMAGDHPTGRYDLRDDLNILLNMQHKCGRFKDAREVVERLLRDKTRESAGKGSIWLAGHSLGASIALDVGRHMMIDEEPRNLPTFLFNPPHVSLAPVIGEKAKKYVYIVSNMVRYVMGKLVPQHKDDMEELFERLVPWVPNLYVNRKDFICKGFIDYFEERERMKQKKHRRLASAATLLSFRDMTYSFFGGHSERPHLLPSAKLWKSLQRDGHDLMQWWQPQGGSKEEELLLSHKLYTWHIDV